MNTFRNTRHAAVALLALGLAAGASTGHTAQQEARALSVTATIQGNCSLTTTPMAFGNLNMSGTSAQETAQATVNYKCASGVVASNFTVGGSNSGSYSGAMTALSTGNSDTIPFTITWSEPGAYTGQGFGVAGNTVTLTGTTQYTAYKSAQPGNYATTVIVAVDY